MGGEQIKKEKKRIKKGINVLTTTPGRLVYHLQNTQSFKIENLQTIVFEEADRILDMGFQKDLDEVVRIIKGKVLRFEAV